MATSPPNEQSVKTVHYVIAVHGIGEQRKNETVLPVISEFAAARHNAHEHTNLLTLGLLASQSTDNHWIELDEIPAMPDKDLEGKRWLPNTAANPEGNNIRFLDFIWSDVTREQHPQVGQSVKDWTDVLINRLKVRKEMGTQGVDWIIELMDTMQEGVLLVQKILNLRAASVSNRIFNDFLGDVEIYGNFPHTRGRAVRLFHEMMAKLHAEHANEFGDQVKPQYTIIAHSLGTVMTLDAITYARANEDSRRSTEASSNPAIIHFPGYDGSQFSHEHSQSEQVKGPALNEPPSVEWVKYLSSYVTLGSPIDKYLALWTENYKHLANTAWIDDTLIQSRGYKIRHFNYSDEQDPVGFELNILKSTPAWQALMEIGEDIVFARYPLPGRAHVDYWNDYDLMQRILDVGIDNRSESIDEQKKPRGHYTEWFKLGAYIKALLLSYVLVPSLGWAVASVFLQMIVHSLAANTIPWLSIVFFLATLVLTHILMELLIMWRLLLVVSRKEESPMQEKIKRQFADKIIRAIIYGTPVLWGGLLVITLLPAVQEWFGKYLATWLISVGLALLVSCDIARIHLTTHRRWMNLKKTMATTFREYF